MIRWFLQIICMLGDIALLTACVIVFFGLSWWLSIPLIYITYKVWTGQGGLIAWTEWRQFMANAKKIGI